MQQPSSPGAPGMNEQVNNHDDGNVPSTLIALLLNLAAPWAAIIPVLPTWLVQSTATIISGLLLFVLNKAAGKWIDRRWPDRRVRRKGDSQDG